MESPLAAPQGLWTWDSGVSHHSVQYTVSETETSGKLTYLEEIDPNDDERGYGSRVESTQERTAFLKEGPYSMPPVEIVEAMLTYFQVEKPSWFDPYRLLIATQCQDQATVRELLAQGVQADVKIGGVTPLYEAIRLHHYAIAEMLFTAGVEVNRRFAGKDETILMVLCLYAPDVSWEPLAARMIAAGADLEVRNTWGETPLMNAASAGRRMPGLVTLLLQAGADVNAVSKHGYTPLSNAVGSRYSPVSLVQELLDAGAEVNASDKEGWTPLMRAISYSLVDCVRCLLNAGADVYRVTTPAQKNRESQSVLQLAKDYADPDILAMIQEASTVVR